MVGKLISGYDLNAAKFENAEALLVFDDALASGNDEYVRVTHILARAADGKIITVRPRDIKSADDSPQFQPKRTMVVNGPPARNRITLRDMVIGHHYYDQPVDGVEMIFKEFTGNNILFEIPCESRYGATGGIVLKANYASFSRDTIFYTSNTVVK